LSPPRPPRLPPDERLSPPLRLEEPEELFDWLLLLPLRLLPLLLFLWLPPWLDRLLVGMCTLLCADRGCRRVACAAKRRTRTINRDAIFARDSQRFWQAWNRYAVRHRRRVERPMIRLRMQGNRGRPARPSPEQRSLQGECTQVAG
jgi:hypothetical protein